MNQNNLLNFSEGGKLLPKEEVLETTRHKRTLKIGIPKETSYQENRVSLCPAMVEFLSDLGHEIYIEKDAGSKACFTDHEYGESGGRIVRRAEEVFQTDMVLKIAPLSKIELGYVKERQTIVSALHFTAQNAPYFKTLMNKKITAISFEHIRDKTNAFPVIQSLSEIVGNNVMMIAGEYLGSQNYGKGLMVGGISGVTPTEVVIFGAGTVGVKAARVALGLGASIKVFDNSIYKLRSLQDKLGVRLYTSVFHPKVLEKALINADVVIGALHYPEGQNGYVIGEEMVKRMKEGSVIIDVSIDQGGCFETSRVTNHNDPVFIKHGVTHYGVPNICSRVPRTASYAISNYFANIIQMIGEEGGIEHMLKADYGVRQGVYLYKGILSKKFIGERYGLPYQDIELLMAAYKNI